MGKAAKWFRGIFGLKKDHSLSQLAANPPKRRWSFVKKHAIAAAEKITSSGRSNATTATSAAYISKWAVIVKQAHFRGHLAKRALRALKGLVKLQALVRGHIVRKQTVDLEQCLQVLLQAQARACAGRAQISESPHSSNKSSQFKGPATPEKFERAISSKVTKHDQSPMLLKRSSSKSIARVIIHQDKAHTDWMGLDHKMDEGSWDRKRRHAKWFRGLFGLKKDHSPSQSAAKPPKRRWSFVKSHRERDRTPTKNNTIDDAVDPSKHAIAAAEKITSSGRSNATTATSAAYVSEWAVIAIQAHFRGYLAKRALRALKGLVKLQALVRGHIVRKQTVDLEQCLQVLLQAQARACAGQAQISESPHSSNKSSQFKGPATPEKFTKHDQSPMLLKVLARLFAFVICYLLLQQSTPQCILNLQMQRSSSKSIARVMIHQDKAHNDWMGLDHKMDEGSWDRKQRHGLPLDQCNHSFSTSKDSTAHPTVPSPSSCEVHSLCPLKSMQGNTEESPFCTANNGPQFYSASSRSGSSKRGPFTPSKSDRSRSNLSCHYPNCMACTESSRAKVRSLSAPKQRPQFESSVSSKRYSVHGYGESRSSSLRVSANFANKAYLGSGRLERLGMPV
ncbi:Protein IQ-DOMAIN 31 [Camellia lanceoleosa]|uniref:Protein IQ-DOMAIN 31 n=1 Tax=Camellia lanceoleosa TaxID=1840588 RepID=A0ACC0FFH6_9ERIC|nr:Protein IQ-DOMAIN 31 [Camellia lanceoleosa]